MDTTLTLAGRRVFQYNHVDLFHMLDIRDTEPGGGALPRAPRINIPAWVFCVSWHANFEFRVTQARPRATRSQAGVLTS